jgi:predicted RNA binding protein YcfA (HicA-like mRNA interferase family)
MGKLKPLPQKRIINILQENGFRKIKSAKHITFKKTAANGRILTTWIPHHREITVFVIQYIIKQTEKPRKEFEV